MLMGIRIKRLRKKQKLNQEELGEIVGVTKVSICGYERGTRSPSLETLTILADYFGVSIDYLFGREVKTKQNDYISEEDVEIINLIKKNDKLYNKLIKNKEQTMKLLLKKLGKNI